MSSKFVFGILAPAVLIVAVAIFLKQHFKPVSPAPVASTAPTPAAAASEISPLPATPLPPPAPAPAPAIAQAMTPAEIQTEKNRLSDWEMNNDPQSLSNILADLHSPEKEIRMAAIEATIQFDDTNAAPILRSVATNTEDLDEKVALFKAADYLALPDAIITPGGTPLPPDVVQAAQQRNAQYQAQKQARMQQNQGQNQNTPPTSSQTGPN